MMRIWRPPERSEASGAGARVKGAELPCFTSDQRITVMSSTRLQAKMERFEKGNAEAAFIILSDPGGYTGLLREWAMAFAYRMVTTAAGRYPELERLLSAQHLSSSICADGIIRP